MSNLITGREKNVTGLLKKLLEKKAEALTPGELTQSAARHGQLAKTQAKRAKTIGEHAEKMTATSKSGLISREAADATGIAAERALKQAEGEAKSSQRRKVLAKGAQELAVQAAGGMPKLAAAYVKREKA